MKDVNDFDDDDDDAAQKALSVTRKGKLPVCLSNDSEYNINSASQL